LTDHSSRAAWKGRETLLDSFMSRLDQTLVERGLCESRERAKRAILAGSVKINGQPARKPSDPVKPEDQLLLVAPEKYVSRGGHKLEQALRHFNVNVSGQTMNASKSASSTTFHGMILGLKKNTGTKRAS
jgi:ribosomal protein S4